MKRKLLCIILISISFSTLGQSKIKSWLDRKNEIKTARYEAGLPYLTPLLGPGYTPEAGLLLAGGFLYTFKTNPADSLIQRSSLPITLFGSTRGNVGLNAKLVSFWLQDRIRFKFIGKYAIQTDNYFGVGFGAANSLDQSDSTTRYEHRTWIIRPEFLFRMAPDFYLGTAFDFNRTKVTETNPLMDQDPDFLQFGDDNLNTGIGFSLNYDSRDLTVNAYKGMYARAAGLFYGEFLGGKNQYQIYEIDFRTYHQITRPGNTIALKLYTRFGYGNIPYEELTRLGGGDALRGYIKGQYRDRAGIIFQGEWRHMFLNPAGDPGKHGIALWIGSGSMAESLSKINEWIPNLGLGYRWEVQPRMNLRIDFGLGRESSGLYFNFSEAF